jgi:hypothetical protein
MSQGPHFFKKAPRESVHATAAENNHDEALEFRALSGRWLLHHRKDRLPHRLFVGLQDLQLLAGLQRVAPFFYFVRCARCHIQAIVKLTVTGLYHCLVQIALGKITRESAGKAAARARVCSTAASQLSLVGSTEAELLLHGVTAPPARLATRPTIKVFIRRCMGPQKSPRKRGGSRILRRNDGPAAQEYPCTAALLRS